MRDTPSSNQMNQGQPDHRDLYLLVVGLALGLLLSQYGLGWFAPDTYEKWFMDGQEARIRYEAAIQDLDQKVKDKKIELAKEAKRLGEISDTAVKAQEGREKSELTKIYHAAEPNLVNLREERRFAQQEQAKRHRAWLNGLILVLVISMIGHALIEPGAEGMAHVLRSRLTTMRYALMAGWIALFMAKPDPLESVPVAFVLMLGVVIFAAAMAPRCSAPSSMTPRCWP